jgi:hypothetical protein
MFYEQQKVTRLPDRPNSAITKAQTIQDEKHYFFERTFD